jgi:hypothetical protein
MFEVLELGIPLVRNSEISVRPEPPVCVTIGQRAPIVDKILVCKPVLNPFIDMLGHHIDYLPSLLLFLRLEELCLKESFSIKLAYSSFGEDLILDVAVIGRGHITKDGILLAYLIDGVGVSMVLVPLQGTSNRATVII